MARDSQDANIDISRIPVSNPARKNHPFLPGGRADIDSRARAVAWLKKYIKP